MSSFIVKVILVLTTLCALPLLSFTVLFSSDFLGFVVAEDLTKNASLDADDIVPYNVDVTAMEAMEWIHGFVDSNDDGHISLQEGSQVENGEGSEGNAPIQGIESDSDGQMTMDEFWGRWIISSVYNWTVDDMCQWIASDDVLSIYEDNFRQYGINGSFMPIIALPKNLSSPLMVALFKGPKSSKHTYQDRSKLQHKAWGVVLWGYKQPPASVVKDVLVAISVVFALVGLAYGYRVQRDAADIVKHMRDQMERLKQEAERMDQQDDLSWHDNGLTMRARDEDGSNSSLDTDSSTRYQELCEELAEVKRELRDAEARLEEAYDSKWQPPTRLISRLKQTYMVEAKYYQERKEMSKQNMEKTSKQMLKIQNRGGIFNSFRLIHGGADKIDIDTQKTIQDMKNIRKDIKDHRDRWEEIETLCGCTLRKVHISKTDDDDRSSETASLKYAKSSPKPLSSSSLKHSQRNSASSGSIQLPSSSTPTLNRRSLKPTTASTERRESVEEVDSSEVETNVTTDSLQKSNHHHHNNNTNSMRQYPSSSMVHNATSAFKKDYKRRSADAAVPNRIKQSPSLNMGAAVAMANNDTSSRPSSADIKSTSSFVSRERSVSSVSLPDVYREHYRNGSGGGSSLTGSDRYNGGSPLPTINNSDSDTNSDTLSIISSTSSKTSKKKHSFRFFNKIKTKLK